MLSVLWMVACSDYDLKRDDDATGGDTGAESGGDGGGDGGYDGSCTLEGIDAEEVGIADTCSFEIGGFEPIVEWQGPSGKYSYASPAVGDLDGDGLPEIVVNVAGLISSGELIAYHGDGSGTLWSTSNAETGYGSSPAIADIDGDGAPEIWIVREYQSSLLQEGDYTVVMYDNEGVEQWESDHFVGLDFDYATAVSVSDMEHDGEPEVVAGRVVLDAATGETRTQGAYGRGSYGVTNAGGWTVSESSVSAIVDIDLDGDEEVIVGNAMYTANGGLVNADPTLDDGMVAIANLDDDPEGEVVLSTWNTIRANDTDGTTLWGPLTIPSANIMSPAAIDDIDVDGEPEIVVAGGNEIWALDKAGNVEWSARVTDSSGASGAAIFDFEGDGFPEVVYADEVQLVAYDGRDGTIKFQTYDHASVTMMDNPVIADVDADGHAEVVVVHSGNGRAFSVYGDKNNSWAPARGVWNQHAYSINNINDDLTLPLEAVPTFTEQNSWHSQIAGGAGVSLIDDLEPDIVDVCDDPCGDTVEVLVRLRNRSGNDMEPGVPLALYGEIDGELELWATTETTDTVPSGWTSEGIELVVNGSDLAEAEALWLGADDDGTGSGILEECSEDNNLMMVAGPFCE